VPPLQTTRLPHIGSIGSTKCRTLSRHWR